MNVEPLQTADGSEFPCCRQLSVFLENRLGQLLRLMRILENEPISVLGMSVEGTIDCAIVRLLVDDPDAARDLCSRSRIAMSESEILVVELPTGRHGIATVCQALIAGEININYTYTMLSRGDEGPCLAIQVDNIPNAVNVLTNKKLRVLDQSDLTRR